MPQEKHDGVDVMRTLEISGCQGSRNEKRMIWDFWKARQNEKLVNSHSFNSPREQGDPMVLGCHWFLNPIVRVVDTVPGVWLGVKNRGYFFSSVQFEILGKEEMGRWTGEVWVHVWVYGEVRGRWGVCGRLWGEEKSKKEKSPPKLKKYIPLFTSLPKRLQSKDFQLSLFPNKQEKTFSLDCNLPRSLFSSTSSSFAPFLFFQHQIH